MNCTAVGGWIVATLIEQKVNHVENNIYNAKVEKKI